jgi:hypothetical protein
LNEYFGPSCQLRSSLSSIRESYLFTSVFGPFKYDVIEY